MLGLSAFFLTDESMTYDNANAAHNNVYISVDPLTKFYLYIGLYEDILLPYN